MASRSGRRKRRHVTAGVLEAPTLISRGHGGVPCSGSPEDPLVNACPTPASEFLLTSGYVDRPGGDPTLGWVCMAFCERHKAEVLRFVLRRVGPLFAAEAIVAEVAALPLALREVCGIDAAIEGLDAGVVTNLFAQVG